jgi:hypothetical protein
MPALHRRGTQLQPGTIVQVNEKDVMFLPDGGKWAYRVRKDFITLVDGGTL